MREIILHLGLFKTASTYLQHDIFQNMDEIFYVKRRRYNHTLLPDILTSDYISFKLQADHFRRGFEELMGDNQKVVLSHEIFSGNPYFQSFNRFDIAAKLKLLFPAAKVIIGLRGQVSLIDSLYREYIVQGGVKSFDEFALNPGGLPRSILDMDPHLNLNSFCYFPYIKHLADLFGRERLFVYPFEILKVDKVDFLARLCRFLDVSTPPESLPVAVRREGLGNFQLAILRRINRLYRSAFYKHGVIPHRYSLANLLRETNRVHDRRDSFAEKAVFPVDFDADNARLDREFDLGLEARFRAHYFTGQYSGPKTT